jgi:hypothetical protein
VGGCFHKCISDRAATLVLYLDGRNCANLASSDKVTRPAHGGIDTTQMIDCQANPSACAAGYHCIGLLEVKRQGLLAQHMHAVRCSSKCGRSMLRRLGCHDNKIEALVI